MTRRFAALFSILSLSGALCLAQETGVSGKVTDPSGATIANAVVSASGSEGTKVQTVTNAQGGYQLPALRAGSFVLRFEAPGFAPAERSLTLLVGQVANIEVALQVASATSAVSVEAAIVAVDTTSSSINGDVSPTEVSKVPLNGRNYLQLAMMVPGITANTVSNTPIAGNDGGKVQINVDGQQVTQNSASSGFGQPQYSQDAIDQFQIITNRFDATMGRSARLQVNVQTKSGTNAFHGTLYGYFRNDYFNAADSVAHKVLPFSDQQFGGTVGGPILKDKLFFFFAYEGERQPNTVVDTPQGFGGITYTFSNEFRSNSYLFHADWMLSSTNHVSVRASGFTYSMPSAGITGTGSPTRMYAAARTSYSVLGTLTSTLTPALVNEVKIGLNHFDWTNTPALLTPQYSLPSITIGSPYNYPQQLGQNTSQYRDDVFWLKGNHSFKFGGDYLHTPYSGNFGQNVRGAVSFTSAANSLNLPAIFPVWNDPSTWNIAALNPYVSSYTQGFGNYLYSLSTNAIGFWFQDDWKVTPRLTLNLGLRYDNDLGIFTPGLYLKNWTATPHHNDNLLFQPRFGFAWDLTGSRKTVIRGGAGLFYADIQANATIDDNIFNGQTTISPTVTATAGNPINLLAPFGSTTGAQFLSGAVPVAAQQIQPLGPNVHTPYSFQVSGGLERQLTKSWTLSADFVHFRIYRDWERVDSNVFYNPATGYAANPALGRPDPAYAGILAFTTPNAAGALYNGLLVGIQHRFAQNFSATASYTLMHEKDSTGGPFSYPNNQMDLASEWSVSSENQANTLTLTSSYQWKWGLSLSGTFHYGSGQSFATTSNQNPFNLTGVSSRLFTANAAYYTSLSNLTPETLAGVNYYLIHRNSFTGLPIERLDMRLTKVFTLKERFRFIPMIEAFNLLNHANFGSYTTGVNLSNYGTPTQNSDLAYAARMLQFAGRFEF
jgi:hypothetical protein